MTTKGVSSWRNSWEARPHPAVSADDEVIGEAGDPAFHAAHPSVPAEVSFDQRFREDTERVEHGAHAEDDDRHGEDPAALAERMNLLVANSCHGGQHHEE